MNKLNISVASLNDVAQLMLLVNSAYRGEGAKKGWTHEADLIDGNLRTDEDSLKTLMNNSNAVILKCTDDENNIAGCVYLKKQNKKIYLGMLSVSPEIQGQGIGKKLLKAAEEHAKNNNCTVIEMTVISIRDELIAWYERNGYLKTKDTKPFHEDKKFGIPKQALEFIIMKKPL